MRPSLQAGIKRSLDLKNTNLEQCDEEGLTAEQNAELGKMKVLERLNKWKAERDENEKKAKVITRNPSSLSPSRKSSKLPSGNSTFHNQTFFNDKMTKKEGAQLSPKKSPSIKFNQSKLSPNKRNRNTKSPFTRRFNTNDPNPISKLQVAFGRKESPPPTQKHIEYEFDWIEIEPKEALTNDQFKTALGPKFHSGPGQYKAIVQKEKVDLYF